VVPSSQMRAVRQMGRLLLRGVRLGLRRASVLGTALAPFAPPAAALGALLLQFLPLVGGEHHAQL